MSFKRVGVLLVLLGVLLGVVTIAHADKDKFIGVWKNVDPYTDGMTKLVISSLGSHYYAQGYGACAPSECEWGATDLVFLAYSDDTGAIEWATASWDGPHNNKSQIILHFQGNQLVVDYFNIYPVGDGHLSWRSLYIMQK